MGGVERRQKRERFYSNVLFKNRWPLRFFLTVWLRIHPVSPNQSMSKQTNKQPIDLHIVWRLLWSSLIAHSQPRESMDKQTDSLTDSWLIQQKTPFGSESKNRDIMSLNGKDVWCLWAHERWESYKPVRGLSLLFPSEVSGEKKRRRQRRRNQFFCRVKQLFTEISTNGDERRQAKEKQEEKKTLLL